MRELKNDGERFNYDELVLINCYGEEALSAEEGEEDLYGGDTWANHLCTIAENRCLRTDLSDRYAPDYDGDTKGRNQWISVLIPRESLSCWQNAAAGLIGGEIEISESKPEAGRYGNGGWAGVILADDGESLWWLE